MESPNKQNQGGKKRKQNTKGAHENFGMGMQTRQIQCSKDLLIKNAKKSLLTLRPAQVTVTPILQEIKLKYETIILSTILLRWRLKRQAM